MTSAVAPPDLDAVLVGGLGSPHDDFVAASVRALGMPASTTGPFDADALDRGRRATPRGQCAPAIYTTGALLRAVGALPEGHAVAHLGVTSCGPCRYALFPDTWQRALLREGLGPVHALGLTQDGAALAERLAGPVGWRLVDAVLAADVLSEMRRRVGPHVQDVSALDRFFDDAVRTVVARLDAGDDAPRALLAVHSWHRGLVREPVRARARVAVIGDPWSMHVDGDGQMHLPRLLARAGVEVELPPVALWLAYLLWQAREAPWGRAETPDAATIARVSAVEERLRARLAELGEAVGLVQIDLPSIDELAELAAPHLPSSLRGGYGHIEVGLAARAVRERRAHLLVSVKSFGCVPSAGVSDAILPAVLGEALPLLVLEVSGDGEAARESRLAMHLAAAQEHACAELEAARINAHWTVRRVERLPPSEPLDGKFLVGARDFACTRACEVALASREHPLHLVETGD